MNKIPEGARCVCWNCDAEIIEGMEHSCIRGLSDKIELIQSQLYEVMNALGVLLKRTRDL